MSPLDLMMSMCGYGNMKYAWLLVGILFTACRTKIDVSPGQTDTGLVDLDQDGFSTVEDCDDFDASVYPGSTEYCDGIDNNCNGEVDEGVNTLYYRDLDGDGFGDDSETLTACNAPSDYIIVGNDCDDSNAQSFPGAEELCDERDNDCDGEIDEGLLDGLFLDLDGDGYGDPSEPINNCGDDLTRYANNQLDCDDYNPEVNFNAVEICDGIDNDCDGAVDEPGSGTQLWYADADGDGYGDPAVTTYACERPAGYKANADDCDDTNYEQHPFADELCNLQDDDCDGFIDEDPIDPNTFYLDADSDGFGDSGFTTISCTQPIGYVANDLDCNDTTSAISPNAPEICNQTDNNCNGVLDDNAIGAAMYYADLDGDTFGDPNSVVNSCSAVSGHVLNALDCDDADANQNPLSVEVCNFEDDNCNGGVDESAVDALVWYVDVDSDGYGSLDTWTTSCTQPTGYVGNVLDCNDSDSTHNPDTPEVCNGLDDNCNNQIDEGVTLYSWYFDADSDGFGDPWVVVDACAQPAGMISDNTDCDDTNASINPDADELCFDGVDNNCDGTFDDETAIDAYGGYLDLDGDGYGGGDWESSCDDIYYSQNEDCDDTDSTISPDAIEVCDGIDNDCDGNADAAGLCPCFFDTNNGNNYLFCSYNRTWSVAKGECAQVGYHLVTIDDAAENTWLDGRIDSYSTARWWTGYNDVTVEGYWDWDGPYSSYTNWEPNEPSNSGGYEDCAALNQFGPGGTWNDVHCNTSLYFVCEANP